MFSPVPGIKSVSQTSFSLNSRYFYLVWSHTIKYLEYLELLHLGPPTLGDDRILVGEGCVVGVPLPSPLPGCCPTTTISKNSRQALSQLHVLKYFCVCGLMKSREPVDICPRLVIGLPPGIDHLRH